MKIDFSTVLKTPKGEPLQDESGELTIGALAYQLLMLHDPQAQVSAAHKLRNAKLASRISHEVTDICDISIEEAGIIKELVGKYGSPAAVLAVEEILDPPAQT